MFESCCEKRRLKAEDAVVLVDRDVLKVRMPESFINKLTIPTLAASWGIPWLIRWRWSCSCGWETSSSGRGSWTTSSPSSKRRSRRSVCRYIDEGVVWGNSWLEATGWRYCHKTQKGPAKCAYCVSVPTRTILRFIRNMQGNSKFKLRSLLTVWRIA